MYYDKYIPIQACTGFLKRQYFYHRKPHILIFEKIDKKFPRNLCYLWCTIIKFFIKLIIIISSKLTDNFDVTIMLLPDCYIFSENHFFSVDFFQIFDKFIIISLFHLFFLSSNFFSRIPNFFWDFQCTFTFLPNQRFFPMAVFRIWGFSRQ